MDAAFTAWFPAFAGMTGSGNDRGAGMTEGYAAGIVSTASVMTVSTP